MRRRDVGRQSGQRMAPGLSFCRYGGRPSRSRQPSRQKRIKPKNSTAWLGVSRCLRRRPIRTVDRRRTLRAGSFAMKKFSFLAQHTEVRIQAAWCRRYRPSRELEAKRFPKLKRIETKLLPKEAPGRAQRRATMRAELNALELPEVTPCPSEWTSV